jgi:hypothetical protein
MVSQQDMHTICRQVAVIERKKETGVVPHSHKKSGVAFLLCKFENY